MLRFLKKFFRTPQASHACFGRTDTGMVRKNNEDNFAILVERNLYVVADGMGGHQAGEIASRVATEYLVNFFSAEKIREIQGNPAAIQHGLIASFYKTNEKVMGMAEENSGLHGMGCTLVACLIDGDAAFICHVGDVRAYLDDGYILKQLTTDHSLVVDQQTLGVNGANQGVGRNIITRGIGFPFAEDPEFHRVSLSPGNKILLCSDGLWGMVSDEEMHGVMESAASPEEACDNLVRQANQAGGKDNITAVVVCF
ncbi:MAG: serine/threonine-protein phosphatase [Deltaproteobacteria bacterium]|nr:serine/threonine-protein phosphatase [Deltaproteobacteria bacterium]